MTSIFPECDNVEQDSNPYNRFNQEFVEEHFILFKETLKDNNIYACFMPQVNGMIIEEPDRFVDLGEPTTPTKKNVAIFDTTKSDGSSGESPSQLSPTPALTPLFSTSQSMIGEGGEGQMMEALHNELFQIYSGANDHISENSSTKSKSKKRCLPGARALKVVIPGEKKPKKDEKKNMYGNSFRFIVKEFLSDKYSGFVRRLCRKFGVKDEAQLRDFYEEKLKWSVSLKDLRSFLNYHQHSPGESMRALKQAFQGFYVWFLRKRYTNHILTEDKIVHKEEYLEAKNYLIYLPELKPKRKFKAGKPHSIDDE